MAIVFELGKYQGSYSRGEQLFHDGEAALGDDPDDIQQVFRVGVFGEAGAGAALDGEEDLLRLFFIHNKDNGYRGEVPLDAAGDIEAVGFGIMDAQNGDVAGDWLR